MSEFVDYLHEVFGEFGAISSRKMFGGHGIYHQGLMFGLVADDELFLKVDKVSLEHFEAADCEVFEYIKNGKAFKMSYHRVPEVIFDDPSAAQQWAHSPLMRPRVPHQKRLARKRIR